MRKYTLENYLQLYFGYASFRPGQREIIENVLANQNVFAVLPTGSGKSICYQLPAIINTGTVIIISPLLSLMTDQVKQLKSTGFKQVTALNSMLKWTEKEDILNNLENYRLIYLSPEMIQNERVLQKLSLLQIDLFVIDEAHCISQWGHEFRPDYLRIKQVFDHLNKPTILALTATATPDVQQDILNTLEIEDAKRIIYPMDKPNISFVVEKVEQLKDKENRVTNLVQEYKVPTLIYFSSRDEATKVATILQTKVPNRNIAYYHAGLDNQDRLLIQQQFMNNQLDVICCTNAFGMGINKKDIQLIVHYHIPTQIESFIQEVGRAGREGQQCVSVALYHENDSFLALRLLETELPDISLVDYFLKRIYQSDISLKQFKEDFITRSGGMEPHWRFFRYQLERMGILKEREIVKEVIDYEEALSTIGNIINRRLTYKHKKRLEMLQWVHTDTCRRTKLFYHFQDEIQTPTYMCCDYCDFKWNNWKPKDINSIENNKDWKSLLKGILYQGDTQK
ncbi:RecQ family ATP-dependent DNA helicase [Gracilibacillus kekensis]|uniref:ATP-dependent DNA helicase RecQ n=1 Tax=Gracilibacillus kekensis TaxID=1027249 RepID=A0A1M7PRM3_9BACI|nr:RecQ family ATP-dependent DNA helicase [Gracilibacillus kekensis]SHN20045.1 ATP-dependent DNA helicase RecQ [Gracilibacillus kekensis]